MLLAPFCVLFLAFFVVPVGYAVWRSLFRVDRDGLLGEQSRTVFAGLGNYEAALGNENFVASLGRVLLFAAVEVPVMISLATLLALLLESGAARWPRFFRATFFLPFGVPGVIASIMWGFLYVPGISPILELTERLGLSVNLLDSGTALWSIANIVTWEFAGYNALILIAQLKSIPGELYEAARLDGAGAWQLAWRIKLPLVRPALVLVTVFTIIGTLQLFSEALVLKPLSTGISSTYTPNLAAYNEAFTNNQYSLAAAEAVLLALAACVLSLGFLWVTSRWSKR